MEYTFRKFNIDVKRSLNCFVLDDMCHLAPYADNLVNKHDTDMTRYFAEMKKAVDFLHFKVRI